jgi:hypothetical protein
MAKKVKESNLLETHQDWEIDTPNLTEKEKKQWYTKHVEETQAGNPNMRSNKARLPKFPPPTKEQKAIMEKLDFMGNPIKGWKWKGNKLVKVAGMEKERRSNEKTINPVPKDDAQYKRMQALMHL